MRTAKTTPRPVGRPPVGPPIQIRLPADLFAWLDREAESLRQNRAEHVRELLETFDGG
jgi:Ribbon-helix-helix protein, copG family